MVSLICQREFVTILEDVFVSNARQFDVSKGCTKFKGVRIVVHFILFACLRKFIESIVESLVSRYVNHFSSFRQPNEGNALDEIIISENGPNLHKADDILERAINRYCSDKYWSENSQNGKWHFILSGENIMTYFGGSSKVEGCYLSHPNYILCHRFNLCETVVCVNILLCSYCWWFC